jgi:hypothetical protein
MTWRDTDDGKKERRRSELENIKHECYQFPRHMRKDPADAVLLSFLERNPPPTSLLSNSIFDIQLPRRF